MTQSFKNAIDKYLRVCKSEDWVREEAYKFEFANFIYQNVNWETQSDIEVLEILKKSQHIKYAERTIGIQFIQKSGRKKMSEYISVKDVELLRILKNMDLDQLDWSQRTMSYPALSAWAASLFPEKYYPIPMTGFDETISHIFGTEIGEISKTRMDYIFQCQSYMKETREILSQYPIEAICLNVWNDFYKVNPSLNIPIKSKLSDIDWVWLAQDFHLFVHREILGLYKKKAGYEIIYEEEDPTVIEGNSVLAKHMRYERNSAFILRLKRDAFKKNKMMNCEVCGFSFFETYGVLGEGFIEAHHINPFHKGEGQRVTKKEDIKFICSNCHRMLHRRVNDLTLEELRVIIENPIY